MLRFSQVLKVPEQMWKEKEGPEGGGGGGGGAEEGGDWLGNGAILLLESFMHNRLHTDIARKWQGILFWSHTKEEILGNFFQPIWGNTVEVGFFFVSHF